MRYMLPGITFVSLTTLLVIGAPLATAQESSPAASLAAAPEKAKADAKEADEVVNVDVVMEAMLHNQATVDELYLGKRMQVRGVCAKIERYKHSEDGPVEYLMRMQGNSPYYNVSNQPIELLLLFPAEQREALAKVAPGTVVIVSGVGKEQSLKWGDDVLSFHECRLIRVASDVRGAAQPTATTLPE